MTLYNSNLLSNISYKEEQMSSLSSSKSEDIYNIDIKVIISNAKTDKIFHKLLNLCIKYDIQLFYQNENACVLNEINHLLYQCDIKQKEIIEDLSKKINEISVSGPLNTWLLDIDKIYNEYKKKLKDIEIILYILKNTYNDKLLINMCCSKINYPIIKKSNYNNINSKYIAIYSN